MNKICTACGLEKDITLFSKDRTKKDGHRARCAECVRNKVQPAIVVHLCSREECSTPLKKSQKKYCSRKCSVTVSNNTKKVTRYCANTKCDNTAKKTYCSVKCAQAVIIQEKIAEWLKTGYCVPSSAKGHYVRSYILEEQEGKCELCDISQIWNYKELNFILDHIDGNADNNTRDNLRLICPNCDSQLPTYKSRNKGNGRHSRRQRYAEGKSF